MLRNRIETSSAQGPSQLPEDGRMEPGNLPPSPELCVESMRIHRASGRSRGKDVKPPRWETSSRIGEIKKEAAMQKVLGKRIDTSSTQGPSQLPEDGRMEPGNLPPSPE